MLTDGDQNEEIIDGEEVTADANVNTISQEGTDEANMMLSLEELIKNHIESIDKMRDELKAQKEMYEDAFNNNPTYREHVEKVKEVNKAKSSVRSQIAKQPSVSSQEQKIKDLRFEISEQNKTLSDLLQDYREQTKATQIELRNGQVMEIVSTAKLVRKNTKYNP